ncbi:hypothetical protein [Nocardia jejuensis]|uniref:hypothetical protein n=1 Tax=Nocardia jejuensis TaxID=328049 RepID=UPI000834BB8A|nr:hypothetical protein [Nocardia jejuensis]
MSETSANRSRARRRVIRQAGPPVEGADTGVEVQHPSAEGARPEPAAAAAAAPAPVVDAEPVAAETADVTPADGAAAEPEPTEKPAAADQAPANLDKAPAVAAVALVKDSDGADSKDAAAVAEPESDSADSDSTESDSESAGKDESPSKFRALFASLGRTGTVAAAVALVSALVLIGSTGLFFYHDHRADQLSERRAEYIQVAKQAYLNMSTVKDSTADQDIDRLLSVAGGGLKDEYAQNRDAYKKVFEQLKVESSGNIVSAAIESDDKDSASVLLLAQQTVSNVATNGPMQRDYRIRVHLTRTGDTVTASSVEFVP